MKLFFGKKAEVNVVLAVLSLIAAIFLGSFIGIQFFYEAFIAAKTQVKETFGIVTAADAALQEAEDAQAQADALAVQEAAEAAEALAATEAEAEEAAALVVEEEAAAAALAATYLRTITVNGIETEIDLMAEDRTWFDASQMTTEQANTFVFGDFSGFEVWFNGEAVEEGSAVEIELDTLSVGVGIPLVVTEEATGETRYYYIRTLHSSYDAITVGEGDGDGYYYFTSETQMYKMSTTGEISYYKVEDAYVRDFKQTVVDGVTYYSYLKMINDVTDAASGTAYEAVVMDASYQVIDVITSLSTETGMPENAHLDSHEFLILGENHYMISSYVYTMVDNVPTDICEDGIAYVQATVLQELQDGAVVFEWNSTDYPEFYGWSIREARLAVSSEELYVDYMHYNSTAIDPEDGNWVLSFRSLSSLIKIDSETGEIIWVLSGEGDMFGLTDEQMVSYQHYPQILDDGTITVFDNGTDNEQTRAVEYLLDEENLTVIAFNAYQVDGQYSESMGSAQRLDDDSALYLMGWGNAMADDVLFTEINFDTGEVLFQVIDLDANAFSYADSYRVYKFDS